MSCFFEIETCCNSPRSCCQCGRRCDGCSRCGYRNVAYSPIVNRIIPVAPTVPIVRQVEVAEFTAPASSVAGGSNVLFTATTFNNSTGDIILSGGSVTLAPGVYKVDYFVTVNNPATDAQDVSFALSVNGSTNTASQSDETVTTGSTTISNSAIIFVGSGGSNITLTNVSTATTDAVDITRGNLIVTKLS